MNFKLWLEAEETHPFEQWHKEYMDAVKASKNYVKPWYASQPGYVRRASDPIPPAKDPDEMKKDPRTKSIYVVDVIEIYNHTSGIHGYGDQEDVPASDPLENATPEILIDAKTERQIAGRTAFIEDKSGGSYHDKWARIKVCVIVNDIVDNQNYTDGLEYYSYHPEHGNFRTIKKFFRFESVRQAAEVLENWESRINFQVQGDESREDYWKRMMKGVEKPQQPDPSGYNPSDYYYK